MPKEPTNHTGGEPMTQQHTTWKEEIKKALEKSAEQPSFIGDSYVGELDDLTCVVLDGLFNIKYFVDTIISQTRKEEREAVIKVCQKEMYDSLEEVAQYENEHCKTLVNKGDIKVWIHNLPDSITTATSLTTNTTKE